MRSAFEDLMLVPRDVDHVYDGLARPRDQKGLTGEGVCRSARFTSGYVEAGDADAAVFGDA